MTRDEREALVSRFISKVNQMPLEELMAIRKNYNQLMVNKGQSPLGDIEADYLALQYLRDRIEALERQDRERQRLYGPTAEERADKLARSNHVSTEVAKNYLERKESKERSAWDVMRREIKPAPDPEPAPTIFDARTALHEFYQNNKKKED